jgi:hypothetical protein
MTQKEAPTKGTARRPKKRPLCRDVGGDARSQLLAARLVTHGQAIAARQRVLLADIAEFDQAEAWRGDSAVSMADWLTERCGFSLGTAWQMVRTASRLESLPQLGDALARGQIPLDKAAPLAAVATPETDAELAAGALVWSAKQIRELVAAKRGASDQGEARKFEQRSLRFDDDKCTLRGALTKDDYWVTKRALMARADLGAGESGGSTSGTGGSGLAGEAGLRALVHTPLDQRLADALVALCRGDGGGNSKRIPHTMVIHADVGLLAEGEGTAEITGLGPISRGTAQRLACDAHIIFSVELADGSILDQKRARRSPTSLQRIEIARRDKGCRHPNCSFTEFTEVHHMVPWEEGGETNQSNLITLCGRHHHAVHELGWKMWGDADDIVSFRGPHGHVMKSAPSPTWPRSKPLRR